MDPSQSDAPLTEAERMELRRQMGYPAIGSVIGQQSSFRFFKVYGQMEYRLSTMQPCEYQQLRTYMAQLTALETALLGASDNLDTSKAAVWTHNQYELRNRRSLYTARRMELCSFMNLPPGGGLRPASRQIVI